MILYYFDKDALENADRRRYHPIGPCAFRARLEGTTLVANEHTLRWYRTCRCSACGEPLDKTPPYTKQEV